MNKNVYVVCPGYYKTGGTELAHQLVYKLNQKGVSAKIAYFKIDNFDMQINPAFRQYIDDFVTTEEIKNTQDIVVVPESFTDLITNFPYSKVYVWWMSVNNYFCSRNLKLEIEESGLIKALYHECKSILFRKKCRRRDYLPLSLMDNVVLHLVQSEYAYDFLKTNGFKNIKYLSDYINTDYIKFSNAIDLDQKEDVVLYNPKKGIRFTNKILKANKDIKFVPLINMSNDEIIENLRKSKVYIDFGPHPGKDRLPREAAMMKCCVITGRRGSANYSDIPISEKFKIKDEVRNLPLINNMLNLLLEDYDNQINEFESYRIWITEEEERFDAEIDDVFLND